MNIIYMDKRIDHAVTGGQIHMMEVLRHLCACGDDLTHAKRPQQNNFIAANIEYVLRFVTKRTSDAIFLEDYSQRFYLFLFNFLLRRMRKQPVVVVVNALYFSNRTSQLKNAIDRFVSRIFLRNANLIIAGGESARREIMTMGVSGDKIKVVYPALRSTFAGNSEPAARGTSHKFQLLFVARLNPIKGLEYLLEALPLLRNENIHLRIVGNDTAVPEYTAKIRQIVETHNLSGRVVFDGEVTDLDKLLQIYREADLFVLPSLWDTSPVSLLEAMCVGLPVVATEVGGIPEWIDEGSNGLLVPPRDPKALAAAIQKLYDCRSLLDELGRNSFRKSEQFRDRSWLDVARAYRQIMLDARQEPA